ncbi:cytochrome c oxidase assembly protein [Anatilimnocola sp. NA78]|uniref:cytochrome c oxidase assembly protein n=1 Tax=Anatilimnocola sp. NA78 TaxID=3415683 RepID=UPI003CE5AD53
MRRTVAPTIALCLLSPLLSRADETASAPVAPATFWQSWNWDWLILFNLTLLALAYAMGWNQLRIKTGRKSATRISRNQLAAWFLALAVLFVALISPLHALSEELAAAHMLQHMLIMVVAAPLFVFGSPGQVLLFSMDSHWRPSVARWSRTFSLRAFAGLLWPWLLHAATLWFWHWPPAYQAALADPLVHDAQHLSFFAAACVYWRGIVDPVYRYRLQPLTALGSLFATSLQAMLLGIFLALSPDIWYEAYRWRTEAWNLTPLADQQLAGFLMWMPACLVYPALAALVLGHWLQRMSSAPGHRQPGQGGI